MKKPQGLVFISIPIVGHLIPMVALAKRLIPTFSVTILTMQAPIQSWAATSDAYLRSVRTSSDAEIRRIRLVELPSVEFAIDDNHHAFTTMSRFVDAHKDHVKRAIEEMDMRVVGVVTDFVTSMIDAAKELGIPGYVYFPSSAACLSVMVCPPTPPSKADELVDVIGISPVPANALPSPMTDPNGYDTFTYHGKRFNEAKGIIVNTFKELEPKVVEALAMTDPCLPPIYPVGPMLASSSLFKHECIEWLDGQSPASVIYICFGTFGHLGSAQLHELYTGLDRTGYPYLWVLNSNNNGPLEAHGPKKSERGMVWAGWAPQVEILEHESVGGFVTHCGWNSCLEGVWGGVPMLAWPMYAEQRFNACEMVKDMGVAVEVKAGEVESGIRCLMGESQEGKRVRERVKVFREESRKSVSSGSSYSALQRWIRELTHPTQEEHFI